MTTDFKPCESGHVNGNIFCEICYPTRTPPERDWTHFYRAWERSKGLESAIHSLEAFFKAEDIKRNTKQNIEKSDSCI